jgi:hypothetical protein
MRKVILSAILISGLGLSAYSLSRSASFFAPPGASSGNDILAPENEPFIMTLRQSRLHIEISQENQNSTVSMFDILGNRIFEMPANESVVYSVANLKSGLYFIILKGPKGNFTRKFLHKQEG